MNWQAWVTPALAIAVVTALLSVGALYNRVSTVEGELERHEALPGHTGNSERLARIEAGLLAIDKQLDRMELKLSRP